MIGPHHDGSPLFVSRAHPAIGERVSLRLVTSVDASPTTVLMRTVRDGEPHVEEAQRVGIQGAFEWWQVELDIRNPVTRYRWLLHGGAFSYTWLTAEGTVDHDVPDSTDFILTIGPGAPAWANTSVVYQIFPDRFARASDREQREHPEPLGELPTWAQPRRWTDPVEGRGPNTPFEFFGGDLIGVREHLDHIDALGASVVYLTPIFAAGSAHRYDSTSFSAIDPLLGGDEALRDLAIDVHSRGLRILGDITLNHCGDGHEWFRAAREGREPERGFFRFDPNVEHGYETWIGVPSLPKLDYSSPELTAAMITAADSPVRRWIGGETGFDGWRVDVANMSGRLGTDDRTREIAALTREAMAQEAEDLLLLAEHNHDASEDLLGGGWHGTMNYAGFTRPVWSWLRAPDFEETYFGLPVPIPQFTGHQMVNTMRAFHARTPWSALIASWNILSSHDTARIRSVVGTPERQEAAIALCVGLPGVPMVFAGDEIGLQGLWGEDSRTPFPWQDTEAWDSGMLDTYRTLLSLRTSSSALAHGDLRWLQVSQDAVAFVRELADESVLVVAARGATDSVRIPWEAFITPARDADITHVFGFEHTAEDEHFVIPVPRAGAGLWQLGRKDRSDG